MLKLPRTGASGRSIVRAFPTWAASRVSTIALLAGMALLGQNLPQASAQETFTSSATIDGIELDVDPIGVVTISDLSNDPVLSLINGATTAGVQGLIIGNLLDETGGLSIESGSIFTNEQSAFLGFSVDSTGAGTVTGSGSTWTNSGDFIVGGSSTSTSGGTAVLDVLDEGSLTVGGAMKIWGGGMVNVDGGSLSTFSLDRTLGTFNHDGGLVLLTGGTYVQTTGDLIVSSTGSPQLSFTEGTVANGVENVIVGNLDGESGILTVESGSNLTHTGDVALGFNVGSNGSATVTNDGSVWDVTGDFIVGGSSTSTSGGAGSLLVDDSASLNISGTFKTWAGADVTVNGGGLIATSIDRTLGAFNHSGGTVQIDGGVYTQSLGALVVSGANSPSFEMFAGATNVNIQAVVVGSLGSESGSVTVDGSTLINSGNGSLLDTLGGVAVHQGSAYVGLNAGSSGNALVAGAGSTWTNSHDLYVGHSGTGFFTVDTGGIASNAVGYIGFAVGSSGQAFVDGAGSEWNNSGNVYVGGNSTQARGDGLLRVTSGGTVSAASGSGDVVVWSTGTLQGNGTIDGNLVNHGDVAPGESPGVLTITGDYTQGSTGQLLIELGGVTPGSQHDQLAIQGDAFLDGVLSVEMLLDEFLVPTVLVEGQSFTILTTQGSVSGAFTGLVDDAYVGTYNGVDLFIDYSTNSVTLYTTAVPEPSGVALLSLLAVGGLLLHRRRSRSA